MNAKSFEYKGHTIEIRPTFNYDARDDRFPFLRDVYIDGLRRGGGFSQEREAELFAQYIIAAGEVFAEIGAGIGQVGLGLGGNHNVGKDWF